MQFNHKNEGRNFFINRGIGAAKFPSAAFRYECSVSCNIMEFPLNAHIYVNFVHTHTLILLAYMNSYTIDKKLLCRLREARRIFMNSFVSKFLSRKAFQGVGS